MQKSRSGHRKNYIGNNGYEAVSLVRACGVSCDDNAISDQISGVTNCNVRRQVLGGTPSPRVTWWRDHLLVDDSFVTGAETTYKGENSSEKYFIDLKIYLQ